MVGHVIEGYEDEDKHLEVDGSAEDASGESLKVIIDGMGCTLTTAPPEKVYDIEMELEAAGEDELEVRYSSEGLPGKLAGEMLYGARDLLDSAKNVRFNMNIEINERDR